MKTTVIGMNYGKTPEGELKFFQGMLLTNEVVPVLIVCDQYGWVTGGRRENYRVLINARVLSISDGNEHVLGEYVLEADKIAFGNTISPFHKNKAEIIHKVHNFPIDGEMYMVGRYNDKYFFAWGRSIPRQITVDPSAIPSTEIRDGESGIQFFDTLKEAEDEIRDSIQTFLNAKRLEHLKDPRNFLSWEDAQEFLSWLRHE